MSTVPIIAGIGSGFVDVVTTSDKPHSPEYWAERLSKRIIGISESAHPAIRAQAEAFQQQIAELTRQVLMEARRSDRAYLGNKLREAGHADFAQQLQEL